jgi:Sigma-70, region 4.
MSPAPSERDREMFRLRTVEGLTLDEIADRFGLHKKRVRQLLNLRFRLTEPRPPRRHGDSGHHGEATGR